VRPVAVVVVGVVIALLVEIEIFAFVGVAFVVGPEFEFVVVVRQVVEERFVAVVVVLEVGFELACGFAFVGVVVDVD